VVAKDIAVIIQSAHIIRDVVLVDVVVKDKDKHIENALKVKDKTCEIVIAMNNINEIVDNKLDSKVMVDNNKVMEVVVDNVAVAIVNQEVMVVEDEPDKTLLVQVVDVAEREVVVVVEAEDKLMLKQVMDKLVIVVVLVVILRVVVMLLKVRMVKH
jgi:hypothetical protein